MSEKRSKPKPSTGRLADFLREGLLSTTLQGLRPSEASAVISTTPEKVRYIGHVAKQHKLSIDSFLNSLLDGQGRSWEQMEKELEIILHDMLLPTTDSHLLQDGLFSLSKVWLVEADKIYELFKSKVDVILQIFDFYIVPDNLAPETSIYKVLHALSQILEIVIRSGFEERNIEIKTALFNFLERNKKNIKEHDVSIMIYNTLLCLLDTFFNGTREMRTFSQELKEFHLIYEKISGHIHPIKHQAPERTHPNLKRLLLQQLASYVPSAM